MSLHSLCLTSVPIKHLNRLFTVRVLKEWHYFLASNFAYYARTDRAAGLVEASLALVHTKSSYALIAGQLAIAVGVLRVVLV